MDKRAILGRVIAALSRDIDAAIAAAMSTRDGATHEENRPEHDKDTRAIEASYLAGAQAERVADLRSTREALASMRLRPFVETDAIGISALVTVECEGDRSTYFLVPQGGGLHCEIDGEAVQLVTPRSPIGAALLGKNVGDEAQMQTRAGARTYEVVGVE